MNDRPTAVELLEAVRRFLQDDVMPALDGHLGYQVRVAANVVAIVAREIECGERHLEAEWCRLAELFEESGAAPAGCLARREQIQTWSERLCEEIRAGRADAGPRREAVIAHLEQTVAEKLEVTKGAG